MNYPDRSLALSGLRILLVEDDADTNEFLILWFQPYHAQIRAVATAAEGLQVFTEWRPDILVCDIGLADGEGYALIRTVRARPFDQGGQTPALAVTACAPIENRRARAAGYDEHLTKPVDPEALAAVVVQLTGRAERKP